MTFEATENRSVAEFSEQAYLNYAMYVIMDRALPHLSDGLKPVQRRIVFAMAELGLKNSSKPKKSARTIGDVLGKYHPHGDSACYEAMVLMAQPFSYRYPLVQGQGNWGSSDDPKAFAAMRYTEAKLSAYSELLLQELGQGTVDWQDNFDGTLKEPITLPARVPNILLNGTTGIAVGMATDIPPHNLREVVAAAIALIKQPELDDDAIAKYILAPDLPTKAEIVSSQEDLLKIQRSGRGSYRMRAVYSKQQNEVVISDLPYQVSGAKVLNQIAEQMQAKKLPQVVDLRDESDHEHSTRLVIVLRSNRVDHELIMSHLFATTDLEHSYRVNLNMIGLDGRPQVKSVRQILLEWIRCRQQTVRRRLNFHLEKIDKRLHILAGLLIAYLDIDTVIRIIREEDQPKPVLMSHFNIDEIQAEAILELKLRHLARLEEMEIRNEQDELNERATTIREQLANPEALSQLIVTELEHDAEKFGDDRRSPIAIRDEAVALSELDLLPAEPTTVVLSEAGWIRAAKGHDIDVTQLNYRAGDSYLSHAIGKTNQKALLIDSTGRSYAILAAQLPSARGQGEPLSSRLSAPIGARFQQVLMGEATQAVLLASSHGYGFINDLAQFDTNMSKGKKLINLAEDTELMKVAMLQDDMDFVGLLTSSGRLLLLARDQIVQIAKGKGNKMIQLESGQRLVSVIGFNSAKGLLVKQGQRHIKLTGEDLYSYIGNRATKGSLLSRGWQKANELTNID